MKWIFTFLFCLNVHAAEGPTEPQEEVKNYPGSTDEEPLQIMPVLPSPYSSVDRKTLQKEVLDEVLKEKEELEEESAQNSLETPPETAE